MRDLDELARKDGLTSNGAPATWFPLLDPREQQPPMAATAQSPTPPAVRRPAPARTGAGAAVATEARMVPLVASVRQNSLARHARRRHTKVAVTAAAAAVLLGGIALAASAVSGEDPAPTYTGAASTDEATSTSAVATDQAPAWCPEVNDGAQVSGAGPGDTSTGAGLVLALQYRMYVARNAEAVRAMFAPTAAVAPLDQTRQAIATIPAGTTHCVHTIALAADRFAVSVDERHPDGTTQKWETTVTTTTQPDGRVLVSAITPAGGQ